MPHIQDEVEHRLASIPDAAHHSPSTPYRKDLPVKLVEKVLQALPDLNDRPAVIAVDGMIGAGKTTAARKIQEHFQDRAAMVSTDLFILVTRSQWDTYLDGREIQLHQWYDLDKIRDTLLKTRQGGTFQVPGLYNLSNGQKDYELTFDCDGIQAVILEGLFAFHDVFADLIDVKVFLEAPQEVALERARIRDETVRNIPPEMWQKKIRIYHDFYTPYVEHLRSLADIVHQTGSDE
jgi:uridine kinase